MSSIMKNTWLIFKRNKDFIYMIIIQPVLMFLLMSFLLAYSTTHKVAIINQDTGFIGNQIYEALLQIEGIELVDSSQEKLAETIVSGSAELAIVIGENNTSLIEQGQGSAIQFISLGDSEIEKTASLLVNETVTRVLAGGRGQAAAEMNFSANEVETKWMPISYSLGFMVLKIVGGASLLASLIINERNNKMKDRILLSGVSAGKYLAGMGLTYLGCMMIGSLVYFLAALLFKFDLGMRYPIGFLLMLFTSNALSVSLFLFASTLLNQEGSLWFMQTFILMPMGLLSGSLFPFHLMPDSIQSIANCLPFRWIIGGIESMQKSGSITSALPNILAVLSLSLVLYFFALLRSRTSAKKV